MLVRIEIDRMAANTDEKLDKATLRMAEIEAQLADEMDVSAAVQLERLEELERAIVELNPDQFVRKTDPGARPSPPPVRNGFPSTSLDTGSTPGLPPTAPSDARPTSSEPSLSSF